MCYHGAGTIHGPWYHSPFFENWNCSRDHTKCNLLNAHRVSNLMFGRDIDRNSKPYSDKKKQVRKKDRRRECECVYASWGPKLGCRVQHDQKARWTKSIKRSVRSIKTMYKQKKLEALFLQLGQGKESTKTFLWKLQRKTRSRRKERFNGAPVHIIPHKKRRILKMGNIHV